MESRKKRVSDRDVKLIVLAAVIAFAMTVMYDMSKTALNVLYPAPAFENMNSLAAFSGAMLFIVVVFRRQLFGDGTRAKFTQEHDAI